MDDNETQRRIAALQRELDGYERTGRDGRAAAVRAQLKAYGYKDPSATPPKGRKTRQQAQSSTKAKPEEKAADEADDE